jgi:regulator of protease activity HflC (stomatin/prohibitin superfamily)
MPYSTKTPSAERVLARLAPGLPVLLLGLLLVLPGAITCWVIAGNSRGVMEPVFGILGVVCMLAGILFLRALTVVNPNQAKVVLLFGRYLGTIRHEGFFALNPFTVRKSVSLRAHNFNSERLKVNDKLGNPIEIGAVVVWRVANTAMATFDVEDYRSYVQVQSESAVRHLAANHPYDITSEDHATSLRGSLDEVNEELKQQLAERLALAGIEVLEARLSHLAYAPEIAGAMLKRQQAEAVIAARQKLVDGAVGMVEMALHQLQSKRVVEFDEERKAAMVSNLLVVLCSEHDATPVINTGTLHG